MLATVQLSPNASGGDLAAATFGGWIRYTAPDRGALAAAAAAGASIGALLRSTAWATSSIEPLPAPTAARLCIGWTGSPASTDRLVGDVRRTHIGSDDAFIAASRSAVDDLVAALRGGDEAGAVAAIRRGRALLRGLGDSHGIAIETDALRTLADIAEANGAAGKASGAGGGDCGIALVPAADGRAGERVAAIHDGWRAAGIRPLDLHVHQPAEVHA